MYANLTIQLSAELDIHSFRVWGAIYAAATLLLWLWVFSRTLALLRGWRIFEAPSMEAHMPSSPKRRFCDGRRSVLRDEDAEEK